MTFPEPCDADDHHVLISDTYNNRVLIAKNGGEHNGKIVWAFGKEGAGASTSNSNNNLFGARDAVKIGEYVLAVGGGIPPMTVAQQWAGVVDNRVVWIAPNGEIAWQYGQFGVIGTGPNELDSPVSATFVPGKCDCDECNCGKHLYGGYVIITESTGRIIMVNYQKVILWQLTGLNQPQTTRILSNKTLLVSLKADAVVVEMDQTTGTILKSYNAEGYLTGPTDASRICYNTLITDPGTATVLEINEKNIVVWVYFTNKEYLSALATKPNHAVRLNDGSTLISNTLNHQVIVVSDRNVLINHFGLPNLNGNNNGFSLISTQHGLYAPHDAKIVGDFTGL